MRAPRIFFSVVLAVAGCSNCLKAQEEGAHAGSLEIPGARPGAVAGSGFFGVGAEELTAAEIEKLGIAAGIRLTEVENDSPAGKAGFATGDIILGVDGVEIGNMLQFRNVITARRQGDVVRLNLIQKERQMEKRVTLAARPPMPLVVIPPEAIEPAGPKVLPDVRQRFQRFGLGEDGQRFKMRDNDGTVEVIGLNIAE